MEGLVLLQFSCQISRHALLRPFRCALRSCARNYRSTAVGVRGDDIPLQVFAVQRFTQPPPPPDVGLVLSPAVRYLVGTHNIADPSVILASGPKNRLLKGDVLKYLEDLKTGLVKQPEISKKPPPALSVSRTSAVATPPKPSYTDIPLDSRAVQVARELTESKQTIPHIYFTTECRLPSREGISVIQAVMIKSTALALERLPEANSIWQEDKVQRSDKIDISYHTVQDGCVAHRLISAANRLSLREINEALEGHVRSDTEARGNISIYQAIGSDIKECTGILRPWQSMCLYVSSPHGAERSVLVTLSGDGRVLSLEMAAKWLELLKSLVSEATL